MGEDQLDELELDGPITLRILIGITWGSIQANDGREEDHEVRRLNLELLPSQPSRKSGQWRKKKIFGSNPPPPPQ